MSTPDTPCPDTPEARLAGIRDRIAAAARDAGRDPAEVTLVAVSKTHGPDRIAPLIAAGQRTFGENRVQEAAAKWPDLKAANPDVELHLIGPLQTNKVKDALALFDVIETLDRPKLAFALADGIAKAGVKAPRLFVQVNTGEEPQKAGVAPSDLGGFLRTVREEAGLAVDGLMCIPPVDEEPALHFGLLTNLARDHGLKVLSMGMSADYEVAVRLGATHVRVGTALFGAREAYR
ncbi:MAG: YggS family pyridoxal phosphate-dependent enzyme [Alphaproteobacteria bacterium]|nr:YggS family pyridoxal phosphate-dependent enzyme [Alphaproteobacteria bacterium]MDX5368578.1 YggS family pyridoxal phosphate-dependent enzyme [Alphaproteobacteria bacterium]MDX5463323.1 YggS family pyridoxal phosphate-dependent enzyme [Alphaproteobacteria bacterium]